MAQSASDVTRLLDAWSGGDSAALARLMPLVVDELRQVAGSFMSGEVAGHTLQPTALVNEVYLRLAGRRTVQWRNRAQFFSVAAEIMRRILVDHARRRKTAKHGDGVVRVPIDGSFELAEPEGVDMVALDDALRSLEAVDGRQSRIVELRYFAGLTIVQTAVMMDISPMTVKREWKTARLWLYDELRPK